MTAGSVPAPRGWWLPAAGYCGALLVCGLLGRLLPVADVDRWVRWSSTDLDTLPRNPVGSMLGSALLPGADPLVWVLLAGIALAAVGRRLGPWRATGLVLAGHVVGTLVSQGLLAWRLRAGLAGAAGLAERSAPDVGPSYVVVAGLAAGLLLGRSWWRPACALGLGLLSPYLFTGLDRLAVPAVGHTVAIAVGLALATPPAVVAARRRPAGRVDNPVAARPASPGG